MNQETPVQTLLTCFQCGRSIAQSDLVQIAGNWVCGDCKPAYLSRVMAGTASMGRRYAGFWIRFGARFIDGIVTGVPLLIVFFLLIPSLVRSANQGANQAPNLAFFATFSLSMFVVALLIGGAYEILMLKYRAATLGKMACGLRVVTADGGSLSWGVCIGRFFMWNVVTAGLPYLNMVLMLISSIMLGTDAEKRALHDRVCGTRVIYSRG